MSPSVAALYQAGAPSRLVLPVFVAALAASAFLLFGVQPMFAKMVLPVLGGSPGVWSIATVVFQSLLLAGYAYAHWLARRSTRVGALVHLALMATAAAALPIAVGSGWRQPPPDGEALWLVGLFLAAIGLPFVAVAGNGPLLQAWFSRSGHRTARDPYFLYSASNIGSFAALAAYPILIEPWMPLRGQSLAWSAGFAILAALVAACAVLTGNSAPDLRAPTREAAPAWAMRARWIAASFVTSGLIVAVTAHVSTDIAAVPLLWVLPLALYLLSFVLAFRTRPVVADWCLAFCQAGGAAVAVAAVGGALPLWLGLALHLGLFFIIALICHRELHRLRPHPDHLTDFYLCIALGGALGGIFCGLVAPKLLSTLLEYPLLLAAAFLCRPDLVLSRAVLWRDAGATVLCCLAATAFAYAAIAVGANAVIVRTVLLVAFAAVVILGWRRPLRSAVMILAMTAASPVLQPGVTVSIRSFFGVHRIFNSTDDRFRVLAHGTTIHGAMRIREDDGTPARGRPEPTSYYGEEGAIASAIRSVRTARGGALGPVSLIGLGAGAVACHAPWNERWTFYEIDPEVVRIARNPAWFRFLSECAPDLPIVLGDARLTLAGAPSGQDLILIDAFSSDAIPTHLVTREALGLYLSKLGPNGALVIHVSNRHLDLTRILARTGAEHGLATFVRNDVPDDSLKTRLRFPQIVVAMARQAEDLGPIAGQPGWNRLEPEAGRRPWTDDYSNILEALLDKRRP